jgi:hypothetical protein
MEPQEGKQALSFASTDYTLPTVFVNPSSAGDPLAEIRAAFLKRQKDADVATFRPNAAAYLSPASTVEMDVASECSESAGANDGTDEDAPGSLMAYLRDELMQGMLSSGGFRMFMLTTIILNTVLIGVQTNVELEREYAWEFNAIDFVFLTIFSMEILFKWFRGFKLFWTEGWNIFDFVLVAISLIGSGLSFMSGGNVLRILRVLRAFRTIKSIRMVRGLQMIVTTVFRSLPDMGNIFLLLGIVMYIFAVIGVTLFKDYVPWHFGSLSLAMYTLFVALTQDGWAKVFSDMDNAGLTTQGSLYFFLFIIVGAFVFMNVISGVIVTNFQHAHEEHRKLTRLKFRELEGDEPAWKSDPRTTAGFEYDRLDPVAVRQNALGRDPLRATFAPTFESTEHYILVLAALEANVAQYEALSENIAATIKRVYAFNEALGTNDPRAHKYV